MKGFLVTAPDRDGKGDPMVARVLFLLLLFALFSSQNFTAQTTAFNYQGKLTDGGTAANGSFQMQFKLFDSAGGAGQVGSTITDVSVTVSQGIFSVKLDFGANALSGANRWLEIAVRRNSGESYVTLSPREQIASSPYAVRTLSAATADTATNATNATNATMAATATNALSLGGVAANQYVQTNDPRLSDARNPLPNSPSYIQNNLAQQASSNFNISGNGTVGTLNASGALTIGGVTAPANAPAGQGRIYFDTAMSKFRVSQNGNAFVDLVGSGGVSGSGNTNAISLWSANTTLGSSVMTQSATHIGIGTTTPLHRLALSSGPAWTTHSWSGLLDLENASAIGWRANSGGTRFGMGHTNDGFFIFRTNSELGSASAQPIYDFKMDNAGSIGVGGISLGSDLAQARLNIFNLGLGYGFLNTLGAVSVGSYVSALGGAYGTRSNHSLSFFTNDNAGNPQLTLSTSGNVSIGTSLNSARLNVGSPGPFTFTGYFDGDVHVNGLLKVSTRAPQSPFPLCIDSNFYLAFCSPSSLRYKKDIQPFVDGMSFINRLRPVRYRWKSNDEADIGFIAEEVARIDPLFVTYNNKGEVEGMKYDRLSVVFVNAIREQQQEIKRQTEIIERQQRQIEALINLNCLKDPYAEICKEANEN